MYLLKTNKLTKICSNKVIVNKLNLNVKKGEIYALIGRDGGGKTTILRMISGLLKPDYGEISIFGEKLNIDDTRMFQRIGALIDTPSFYENLTARENLEIITSLRGIHNKDCIDKVLKLVGVEDNKKKKLKEFPVGMRQRLGIALALMHEPEFVILDEPVNGIDAVGIQEIRFLIYNLNKEKNITFLISSHLLSEVENLADTVGIIQNGNLLEETSIEDIRKYNRNYIRIKSSNVTKAIPILEKNLDIHDFEVEGKDVLKIYEIDKDTENINRVLNQHNIGISEIYMNKGNLAEYFNKVTGGEFFE